MMIVRLSPMRIFLIGLFCLVANVSNAPVCSADGPPKVGQKAPDFELKDAKGRSFKLSDFKGNLVLLNFWATWCPPCVEEIPSMDALNQSLKAKKFSMIAVSVDESWAVVKDFWSQVSRPPGFLVVLDQKGRDVASKYGVFKFPETFAISPEGEILKHFVGSVEWLHPETLKLVEGWLSPKKQFSDKKSTKVQ